MPNRNHHASLRIFSTSAAITIIVLALILYFMGVEAMLIAAMLIVIELTFSFDNAIINARTLVKMSPFWRRMFMTVGIFIAVFGMRVIFPVVIVMLTAGLPWDAVIRLAFQEPDRYASELHHAHPSIAAFGGMFLFTLALHFFFDDSRQIRWLHRIEKPLQEINRRGLYMLGSAALLAIITLIAPDNNAMRILTAGAIGIGAYVLIHWSSELFTRRQENVENTTNLREAAVKSTALAGLSSFIYLEVLDASFSFDGVIGAFAVTNDVVIIAAGLGIGALWVRSLTLYIVHRQVLSTYRYLEHAAHYVIGALAIVLLLGLFVEITETYIGLLGVGVIAIATSHSIRDNKRDATATA